MRENFGHSGRLVSRITAVLIAVLATFALTSAARAADTVESTFNDSWIKLPALHALVGSVHALDPAAQPPLTVKLKGDYDPASGNVNYKASEFSFPRQSFVTDFGTINLDINATQDFTGNYNKATGALSVNLPLKLTLDAESFGLKCELRPLNIGLSTSGAAVDFPPKENTPANLKSPSEFTPPANTGAVLGSWTNVTPNNNVFGIAGYNKDATTMTADCKSIITSFTGGDPDQSFDGVIWLGGSTVYTAGPVAPGAVGKVTITKKATVKAGKSVKVKVTVSNSGGKTYTGKVSLKSNNSKVKVPKTVSVSIPAGKSVTKTVTVKAAKTAKGKAKITAKAGSKSATSTITVK